MPPPTTTTSKASAVSASRAAWRASTPRESRCHNRYGRHPMHRAAPLLALVAALAAAGAASARAAPLYADSVLAEPALAGYWALNEPLGPQTADLRTTG